MLKQVKMASSERYIHCIKCKQTKQEAAFEWMEVCTDCGTQGICDDCFGKGSLQICENTVGLVVNFGPEQYEAKCANPLCQECAEKEFCSRCRQNPN